MKTTMPAEGGVAQTVFLVEDEFHAEPQGEFDSLESALAELRRRAEMPWDAAPNRAPCGSWRTCGRQYVVIEFDTTQSPRQEKQRLHVFDISAEGVKWAWRETGQNPGIS